VGFRKNIRKKAGRVSHALGEINGSCGAGKGNLKGLLSEGNPKDCAGLVKRE